MRTGGPGDVEADDVWLRNKSTTIAEAYLCGLSWTVFPC